MKYPTLPQVCCRCRRLKAASEGHFIKSRHKFNRWLWRCSTCEENTISREHRQGRESRYEKIVREALQAVFSHFGIKAEYQVGPYFFDFAVEDLRLLLEIDPHSTHSTPGRKIRDWKKTKLAEEKGWTLVRLVPYPVRQLSRRAIHAVRSHYEEIFPDARRRDAPIPKKPRVESMVDKLVRRWSFFFIIVMDSSHGSSQVTLKPLKTSSETIQGWSRAESMKFCGKRGKTEIENLPSSATARARPPCSFSSIMHQRF